MFPNINVSRSTHCAIDNLTGDPSSRASPDACDPPPYPLWLSARVSYSIAVCGGPHADGDCRLSVLLALQRVSDCAGVSRRELGHTARRSRATLHRCPINYPYALAHALAGRHPQKSPTGLWLVPHAVELCDPRRHAPGQTRH